jgi:NADPH-dependent 2,4-dienoyl-CoA reductase/sulfur reductase-like enzyme
MKQQAAPAARPGLPAAARAAMGQRNTTQRNTTGQTVTTRRKLLTGSAATAVALVAAPALAQARPHIVVVGGGAGGTTIAKYLKRDDAALDVTLVEANPTYVTPFTSNMFLGGLASFETLSFGYDALRQHGVNVRIDRATDIDRTARSVRLASGSSLAYDRLVLSPGIGFRTDLVPGWRPGDEERVPHAWSGGPQLRLLKARLDALADGALVVIMSPRTPYRCPPAPYERAAMIAHAFKARGHTKSRIVILDEKDHFTMQPVFAEGWEKHYPGVIEWQDPGIHGGVKAVDASAGTVTTDLEVHKADLINLIPPQRAGVLAPTADLVDDTGFCPVDPTDMRSLRDRHIHVIGDAAIAGDLPKSGFAANNEAKIVAMQIRHDLLGTRHLPVRFVNHCWSRLAPDDAIKNGARYEPRDGRIVALDVYTSQLDEPADLRRRQAIEAVGWYKGMTADMFG